MAVAKKALKVAKEAIGETEIKAIDSSITASAVSTGGTSYTAWNTLPEGVDDGEHMGREVTMKRLLATVNAYQTGALAFGRIRFLIFIDKRNLGGTIANVVENTSTGSLGCESMYERTQRGNYVILADKVVDLNGYGRGIATYKFSFDMKNRKVTYADDSGVPETNVIRFVAIRDSSHATVSLDYYHRLYYTDG